MPGVRILTTSEGLGVAGRRGRCGPSVEPTETDIASTDAVILFTEQPKAASFTLDATNAEAVGDRRRLDGIPLAVGSPPLRGVDDRLEIRGR
jgi:predicted ATPase